MNRMLLTLYATAWMAILPPCQSAGQEIPIPEQRLIYWLGHGTQSERQAVVAYVKTLGASQRSAALDGALADELKRLDAERRRRASLDREGILDLGDFPADYHAGIIEVLGESSRTVVIPSLTGALDTGWMAVRGLARFGAAAADPVLKVARGEPGGDRSNNAPAVVFGALATLGLILDLPSRAQLPVALQQEIIDVARQRLVGKQHWMVVRAACSLAIATGDPVLRLRVEHIANSPSEIEAMGVSEQRWVGYVERACADAAKRR
jgi:hypothetical protein